MGEEEVQPKPKGPEMNWDAHLLNGEEYTTERIIGQGRFGSVSIVKHEGKTYARREIRADRAEVKDDRFFMRELEVFLKIRPHPAICEFFGYCVAPKPGLIMEYLPNGSLDLILYKLDTKKSITEWTDTVRAKTIFGFACAMMHLHGHGAIHRYLTPRNILFDAKWEPRLVDFGFARADCGSAVAMSAIDASPEYSAPEAIQKEAYGMAVDVYSFGIILWRICTGKKPFPDKVAAFKLSEDIINGKRPAIPDDLCPILRHLIEECWSGGPDVRPPFHVIVKMLLDFDEPLFKDVNMIDYRLYRDRIFDNTYQSAEARVTFSSEMVQAKDAPLFEAAKAEADKGDLQKQLTVARMYARGQGVPVNPEQAFHYYELAARQNDPIAQYFVGMAYFLGQGVKQDFGKAAQWIEQAAHVPEFFKAQVQLALLIENEWGFDPDPGRVISILQKAADPPAAFREAQYHLGRIYSDGRIVPADYARSRYYYDLALQNGEESAANDLATLDMAGRGKARDFDSAVKTLQQAMDRDLPMACFNLGVIHLGGTVGAPPKYIDRKKAKECFEKGASLGHADCMVKLGTMLIQDANKLPAGDEKVNLEAEALRYFKRASDLGSRVASNNYGKLKVEGRGGPPDFKEGIEYLVLAAERGVWQALVKLAELIENGQGMQKNADLARRIREKVEELRTSR